MRTPTQFSHAGGSRETTVLLPRKTAQLDHIGFACIDARLVSLEHDWRPPPESESVCVCVGLCVCGFASVSVSVFCVCVCVCSCARVSASVRP